MKYLGNNSLRKVVLFKSCLILGALGIMFAMLTNNANAQVTTNYYFHINGTGTGYGINPNDNLSWDDMNWSTTATGAPTITWAVGSTPTGPGFARFNSTTTP